MRTHPVPKKLSIRAMPTLAATAVILGMALLAYGGTQYAGTTSLALSCNPCTLGPGVDLVITTTTTAPGHEDLIDDGKVDVEYATDGVGNPVPAASVVSWVAVLPNNQTPDSDGKTFHNIDLDALGFVVGTVGGFRAHYKPGSGPDKIGTHFSLTIDVTIVVGADCSESDTVVVGADLVTGNGTPLPGDGGPWTFRITAQNCTGVDLEDVKLQGGSNGWAPMTGYQVDPGPSSAVSVRTNKKNQVLTWVVDIDDQETVSIEVTVDGDIPPTALCSLDPSLPIPGSIHYLSGAWSAAFKRGFGNEKSDYTGRVSVTVICAPLP